MALFKICRGKEENLPAAMNDGWAYFCTNTGKFFIDWADEDGAIKRSSINADFAQKLRYFEGDEFIEVDIAEIANKVHEHNNFSIIDGITAAKIAAWDAAESNAKTYADGLNDVIAQKSQVQIITWEADD